MLGKEWDQGIALIILYPSAVSAAVTDENIQSGHAQSFRQGRSSVSKRPDFASGRKTSLIGSHTQRVCCIRILAFQNNNGELQRARKRLLPRLENTMKQAGKQEFCPRMPLSLPLTLFAPYPPV
jgi:hypothetical protein